MLSIQGIYDGKVLRFFEKIKIHSPQKVIVTFLDDIDDDISSEELHQIASEGGAFYFLENEEEDIYTDADLLFDVSRNDFSDSGLKKKSVFKLDKIATLNKAIFS